MELMKFEAPELEAIEKSKAEQIRATFEPMAIMLAEFEEKYNKLMAIPLEGITVDLTKEYKRLRLDIGRVRIDTGKAKDKAKEYLKLEDKAIMGIHNILVWAVKEKEDNLKERENYFEIQEKKRLEELQNERVELLAPFVEDAHERQLSNMENDVWDAYLSAKKKEYTDRIEAEKQAELERIEKIEAEKAEQERIRKENEQLRKEAEENERLAEIERKKIEKEREEAEEKALIEAKKLAKIEAELKAKQEAEQKAREDEEKRLQAELSKGDSAKVKDLISDLEALKTKYSFKSVKNQKMYSGVCGLLDKIVGYIHQ